MSLKDRIEAGLEKDLVTLAIEYEDELIRGYNNTLKKSRNWKIPNANLATLLISGISSLMFLHLRKYPEPLAKSSWLAAKTWIDQELEKHYKPKLVDEKTT